MRATLLEIAADEAAHLELHRDFFASQTERPLARAAFAAAWLLVATLACGLVLFDHRRTLRATGIGVRALARSYAALAWDALRATPAARASRAGDAQRA